MRALLHLVLLGALSPGCSSEDKASDTLAHDRSRC